ncbi:hypothetical protein F4778DRAFT_761346 [Xylariomycetidae sp. FL2044]|nr:hypothetical protein F4778DRAFT_761346 [Xylariomycetidae sp. FL2044]
MRRKTIFEAAPLIFFALVSFTVAQHFAVVNPNEQPSHPGIDDQHGEEITAPIEPQPYEGFKEPALVPRIDFGGLDINMDTLADDVYDKVGSKVQGAVDDATKGIQNTMNDATKGIQKAFDEAQKGFEDLVDGAKKILEDIKNSVEKLYEEIKAKVAELEKELGDAIKKWVWEHIGKPLLTLAIIILAPIVLMILWWFLHLLAKIYLRVSKKPDMNSIEMRTRYQTDPNFNGELEGQSGGGGRRFLELIVSSWENYGQGLICLICPWYASFVLWREKKRVRKELVKLRRDVDELYKAQYRQERSMATKEMGSRM